MQTRSDIVSMTGMSTYNHANMTTQQTDYKCDDVISVGADAFHIMTTHLDASQLIETTTEVDPFWQMCPGTFFLFQ